VERWAGVRPAVSAVVIALQDAAIKRIDTSAGLTTGVGSKGGVVQGDNAGPVRSLLALGAMQEAVEALVAGFDFSVPAAVGPQTVPEVFFAVDGAFVTNEPRMLQLAFDVVSTMARLEGLEIRIKDDGSKTAWLGLEWRDGGWHDCGDGRVYKLLDGREVPRNPTYKHLGTMLASLLDHTEVRERVVRRCSGVVAALARLGVLNTELYARASSAAVLSVLG